MNIVAVERIEAYNLWIHYPDPLNLVSKLWFKNGWSVKSNLKLISSFASVLGQHQVTPSTSFRNIGAMLAQHMELKFVFVCVRFVGCCVETPFHVAS
jgi:hypothetical protein